MKYKEFEQALERLQQIVEELEKGDLALEKSLELFEEGIKISRFCGAKLDEAERKVEILLESAGGELKEEPFEVTDEEGS